MSYQILIVEDDRASREIARKCFLRLGIEVLTFEDGATALRHLEAAAEPDLIVLDINLPEISGIELMRHLRQRLGMQNVKIVVWTANHIVSKDPHINLADLYLEKPISGSDLVELSLNLLNGVAT